jgi:hypothetical protein
MADQELDRLTYLFAYANEDNDYCHVTVGHQPNEFFGMDLVQALRA